MEKLDYRVLVSFTGTWRNVAIVPEGNQKEAEGKVFESFEEKVDFDFNDERIEATIVGSKEVNETDADVSEYSVKISIAGKYVYEDSETTKEEARRKAKEDVSDRLNVYATDRVCKEDNLTGVTSSTGNTGKWNDVGWRIFDVWEKSESHSFENIGQVLPPEIAKIAYSV